MPKVDNSENSNNLNKANRQGVQVIARAAEILRILQQGGAGLSLGELARAANLPRSTVQRIVDALAKERFVVASSSNSGVQLGPALIPLGSVRQFPVIETVRPTLQAIANDTGETVDLSVADTNNMIFIDQVPGTHRLSTVSAVGVAFPFHSGANGKAALAAMDTVELQTMLNAIQLSAETVNTITNAEHLQATLLEIRKNNIALDHEENSLGISAVAMAFRSANNNIYSISIPVPSVRFNESEKRLTDVLTRHTNELIDRLASRRVLDGHTA